MDHADVYAAAQFPDPRKVLGVELRPYCIGHALLLQRLRNPFAVGGPVEFADILVALWVCSRDWRVAAERLAKPTRMLALRWWGWQARWRPAASLGAALLLQDYIADAWRGPDMWHEDAADKDSHAPVLQVLKVTLMSSLHMTAQQALDTPLRVAIWDCAALAEQRGAKWVSAEESEAIDKLHNAGGSNG